MAAIERTAYPRFTPSLTAAELQRLYAPTEEERAFVAAHARGPAQHLTLLARIFHKKGQISSKPLIE